MALQTTFYIMGIIYMSLNILILLAIGVVLFIIYKKVMEIQKHVSQTVDRVNHILKHPEDTAVTMGATAAASAYNKVKSLWRRKGKEK